MSFTEIKAEELKDNPFDLIGKQWMLITAGNEEKCNTMTASWVVLELCGASRLRQLISVIPVIQRICGQRRLFYTGIFGE